MLIATGISALHDKVILFVLAIAFMAERKNIVLIRQLSLDRSQRLHLQKIGHFRSVAAAESETEFEKFVNKIHKRSKDICAILSICFSILIYKNSVFKICNGHITLAYT